MSLNDIQLNQATLAALYSDCLVGDTVNGPGPANTTRMEKQPDLAHVTPQHPPLFRSLGNNRKHILAVVEHPGSAFLPDEDLQFLTRMLTACKLSLDDVAIVNRQHQPEAQALDYDRQFAARVIFLFGIAPLDFGLPVSFPLYQVQQVAQTTYLATQPLDQRDQDPQMKARLWAALKRIFQL